jgi:hypothetical protein
LLPIDPSDLGRTKREKCLGYSLYPQINPQIDDPILARAIDVLYLTYLEKQVDRLCLEFLVRQQPVAGPLRFVYSVIKINLELERIGDYAESIARQVVNFEIDVGLIPAIHFVQLPRLVGKHQAFGPLFLGDPFDAPTAFRMGLLSEIVPKGTALDRAREIARRLAAKSPIVMKIGRDAFMRAVDADFRRSVENAAESFALVATTEDCQEGLNAFVEKRTPNYKGR